MKINIEVDDIFIRETAKEFKMTEAKLIKYIRELLSNHDEIEEIIFDNLDDGRTEEKQPEVTE